MGINPDRQELLRLVKKYTVLEVVACENRGCARQKGSFDGHKQPPKWRAQPRTQPQIAVFVSEVVIAKKVTQNTVFLCFSEKLFWLCPFFRGCVHAKIEP